MKKLMLLLMVISLCSCGVYRSHPKYDSRTVHTITVKKYKKPNKIPRSQCKGGYEVRANNK